MKVITKRLLNFFVLILASVPLVCMSDLNATDTASDIRLDDSEITKNCKCSQMVHESDNFIVKLLSDCVTLTVTNQGAVFQTIEHKFRTCQNSLDELIIQERLKEQELVITLTENGRPTTLTITMDNLSKASLENKQLNPQEVS